VLPGEVTARVGDPFAKTDGTPRLLNFLDADTGQYPMRAVERGIIVQRHRRYQSDDGYFEYVLWDPSSGAERLLWTAPPRKQDMISAGEGDLVVVVRTGMSMPFPEWAMSLRNIATGEERMIAMGDPDLLRTRGLRITLPLGFAPMPSMSGGKVAWAEFGLGASGPEKHVRIYDVEMGSTSTIATLSDAREELLWSPSIGGDRVAWFTAKGMGETVYLVVHELGTGKELRFSVPGAPFDGKLSGDGRYFAWDDGFTAKYALELASGEVTRFANDEGDQTEVSGHYVSWHPKRGAGFYDFESRTVRFSERGGGGAASVLGKWFYWREFVIVNGEEKPGPPTTSSSWSRSGGWFVSREVRSIPLAAGLRRHRDRHERQALRAAKSKSVRRGPFGGLRGQPFLPYSGARQEGMAWASVFGARLRSSSGRGRRPERPSATGGRRRCCWHARARPWSRSTAISSRRGRRST